MDDLVVQPMQWSQLPDISDMAPLSKSERECLREIRDLLKRHGKLDRLAVHVMHRHFDLADDEVLLECSDLETRTLTIRPVKRALLDLAMTTVTTWRLTDTDAVMEVGCRCARTSNGHQGRHEGF